MPLIRTGTIGDGLIRPGPGVPTIMPGSECACRRACRQQPELGHPVS
jgi:hypothetical protein